MMRLAAICFLGLGLALSGAPLAARESLGVFGGWGAFRDPQVPRCYAIAMAVGASGAGAAFASVGTWPAQGQRGQLHVHPSRRLGGDGRATLQIGSASFSLSGSATDLWAADPRGDAAILSAMRAGSAMTLTGRDESGRLFTDRYDLEGVATALDAASVGCSRLNSRERR